MDPPVQEIKDEPSDPNELKYPRLAFPYDKMPEGSLKALTDKACEGGLDPGLVVPAILTLVSTMIVPDYVEGARINLYCCLLAMVGAGKDTAINRSGTVLNLRSNDAGWHRGLVTKYTPSGERSIAQVIGDTPGGKNKPRIPGPRRHCFVTYEIEETLRKNKGDTSGVFTALQDYFDHNEKLYTDPKKNLTQHVNCRLSWLTALPVGQEEIDPDIFRRAFGESSSHGMQSRMIFGFAEKRFDARRTRNWTVIEEVELDIGTVPKNPYKSVADAISNTVVAEFADGVEDQYLAWQPKQDASGRDTYHILKIAIVIATANGHGRIEQSDWDFAVAWQEWQSEIRRVFSPGRAKKATQAEFNEVIIEEMTKRTRKAMTEEAGYKDKNTQVVNVDGKRVYLRWKGMSNAGRWYKYGMDVEKTIDALVRGGQLEYAMEPKFNDKGNYVKDVANEAWVRLIGIGVKQ